ncbi:hypothetical protein TRFO_16489 [Tritrichomonas foetus]|uniref:Uncharacterized protein n=1 Tax=Tritrichomonas foetus TaxID=1144522 RepID=A0A1J4KV58_9EUKA|nr:hypothetical protein TRFO_16489 [Tritrichomonas foetus]|eukprot:OHT13389.1 hypothetical protein TRFO_16489 [Tritrichomonas foetus]
MPMVGAVRTRDGKLISSWIDYGSLSNQFLAEGLVASLFFTVSASSIIAAIYIININSNKPLTEIQQLIKLFGYSSPVWIFFSFLIFKAKIPSFSPSFSSR